MLISAEACRGCGQCVKFCPMHAISMQDKKAVINDTLCVECGVCARAAACKFDAITPNTEELVWPRTMRNILSDPLAMCVDTGVSGRGTEEMKTNDMTLRFDDINTVGIAIDIGRPNVGCCLRDVDKIALKLVPLGIQFEELNPVNSLMESNRTGVIKADIIDEYVLSLVLEFSLPVTQLPELVQRLQEVGGEIDTVFSVGVISRVYENNHIPALDVLDEHHIPHRRSGKVNIGLGHAI